MRNLAIIVIAAITFFPYTAATEPHNPKCDSTMQQDLMDCVVNDFNSSETKLNILYKKMIADAKIQDMESLHEDDEAGTYQTKLRNAQKAWVVFRDAECTRTSSRNRSLYGREGDFDYPICQKKLTDMRIQQLEKAIDR